MLCQVKTLIAIIDLSEYLRRCLVLMPNLGKIFSVALQSLSFQSAIALLTTADTEIQISRNNSSRYISVSSDIFTCIVEKRQLIWYLLYLIQFLQYLWWIFV